MDKINLILPYAGSFSKSMFVYAQGISKEYIKKGYNVQIISCPTIKLFGNNIIGSFITRYFYYPIYLLLKKSDLSQGIIHIVDQSYTYLSLFLDRNRVVVTCHDLIPVIYNDKIGMIAYFLFDQNIKLLRKVAAIITPSQSTKNDLMRMLHIDSAKITVIPHGFDREAFGNIHASKDERLFTVMMIGSMFYKNIENMLKSLPYVNGKLAKPLQLIKIHPFTQSEKVYIEKNLHGVHIREISSCTQNELATYYHQADLLLFVSLYEGFGFPILEAMACGTAVLTSPTSSMPEVGGDAVMYAHPENPDEIAEKIIELHTNTNQTQHIIAKGLERVKLFTRGKSAENHLSLYRQIHA